VIRAPAGWGDPAGQPQGRRRLDFAPLGLGEFGRGLRDIGDNDAGKAQPVGGFALFVATATVGQNGISSKSGSGDGTAADWAGFPANAVFTRRVNSAAIAASRPSSGTTVTRRRSLRIVSRTSPASSIRPISYRDLAVIAIELKEVYIDGELDTVETANWHAKGDAQGLQRRCQRHRQRRR
jgi:hypothetical protein